MGTPPPRGQREFSGRRVLHIYEVTQQAQQLTVARRIVGKTGAEFE